MSLSPPPYREKDLTSQPWQKWFASITSAFSSVATTAQLTWANINKSGSNITDIQTRNHNDLQNIQGGDGIGDFTHITYNERDQLTTGKTTTLHNHPQSNAGQMIMIQEEIYEDSLPGQVALRADQTTTTTNNFIGNLSGTDTNVQQALNTLDKIRITGIPGQDGETAEPEYYMLQQSMTAINLAQTRAVASLRI